MDKGEIEKWLGEIGQTRTFGELVPGTVTITGVSRVDDPPFTLTLLDTTDYANLFTWFCGKCHLPVTVHKHDGKASLPPGWAMGRIGGRLRSLCAECADDHFDVESYREAWRVRRDARLAMLKQRARRNEP